jgi:hypothetical protein
VVIVHKIHEGEAIYIIVVKNSEGKQILLVVLLMTENGIQECHKHNVFYKMFIRCENEYISENFLDGRRQSFTNHPWKR